MVDIWKAAGAGDVDAVERLVGHDTGLLDARSLRGWTPLMYASEEGHGGMVGWLLARGAATNARFANGHTALSLASQKGRTPVVRLLLEAGADPTIAGAEGSTPLITASRSRHLEVVRVLLGHRGGKTTINRRGSGGQTPLWWACYCGRGAIVRALLQSGADPTVADTLGAIPVTIAKHADLPYGATAEGRRECVAALEVGLVAAFPLHP
jgi:ankyrin repeat protein